MPTMQEIETRTKRYADARAKLADIVGTLQTGLDALKREHLPALRRAVARTAELEAELREIVGDSADLFVKPKTVVLHGIRVGWEKGKGAIQIEDEELVVKLIRRKLPELAEQLIKTAEKPLKTGLAQLTVAQLKAIGCQVDEAGDQVVIRAVDRDVDKLVTALLKGAQDEAQAAAA